MTDSSIGQVLFVMAFFSIWFILMRVVLPRLGVPT